MARQVRIEYPGALHHVMGRGNDDTFIFRDDHDRQVFLDLLVEEISRSRWVLHEYSLMGTHYHLEIGTPECTLSTGMHRLLGRYAQYFNRRHRRRGHLFQNRFKNILVEEESYGLVLSRYIALNAVDAGLVARPEEWKWCSYAARAGFEPAPEWLSIRPLLSQFGPDLESQQRAYRLFVLANIGVDEDPMDKVTGQVYLGTQAWFDRIQKIIDQKERSEEHPREQVHPGRPAIEDVMDSVASTFDTTAEAIRAGRGTLERRVFAWLAFEEGLVPLRKIADKLGVKSAGGISRIVSRCRREMSSDGDVRALVEACRAKMRRQPPPFILPPYIRPETPRQYHRTRSHSRR